MDIRRDGGDRGMKRPRTVWLVSAVLVAVAGLARPAAAEACSCVLSLCGGLGSADAVFVATVDSITPPAPRSDGLLWSSDPMVVNLRDLRAVRGEMSLVAVTASGSSSCGYPFEVGERYLIVGSKRPDGRVSVSLCSLTRPLANAAGLLDYARTLDGPPSETLAWGRIRMLTGWTGAEWESEGIQHVRVTITGPEDRTLMTDSEGRFRTSGLPPGDYRAHFEWPEGREYLHPARARPFTIYSGVPHACGEIELLAEIDSSVSGVVLDGEGRPVARAFIYLGAAGPDEPVEAWAGSIIPTDASGRYRFEDLPPGVYLIGLDPWQPPDVKVTLSLGQHLVVAPIRKRD